MTQPTNNGRFNPKNALPTRFGRLQEIRNIVEQKKLRRLVRKAGFKKRSGYKLDELIKAGVLAKCTGAKAVLEVSHTIKDPAICCSASNSTMSRVYEYGEECKVKKLWWGITRGFRLGRGKVWLIDGTFIRVYGDKFEFVAEGWDSSEGKISLGYLLINVYDLVNNQPIFQVLLPGNASEKVQFTKVLSEAMGVCDRKPQVLVFDRGFLSKDNLKWLDERGILWVSVALQNMNISRRSKARKPKTWFDHYEMSNLVKGYWRKYGSLNLVKDETIEDGKLVEVRYLVGSPVLSAEDIIRFYERRWMIEEYHKQIRELGLNVLPTGKFDGLRLHVVLVALVFIILHSFASGAGIIRKSVKTIIRCISVAALVFVEGVS